MAVFMRLKRLTSSRRFFNQVFTITICEESLTEAVPSERVRRTFTRALKLEHIVTNIELVQFFELPIHILLQLIGYVSLNSGPLHLQDEINSIPTIDC